MRDLGVRSVAAICTVRFADRRSQRSRIRARSLPGAINCPVLNETPSALEVGTMDRQQSSFEARRRGAAYVSRNIAHHLETAFHQKPKTWRPLVYCWRGGNRSAAMTHILAMSWLARKTARRWISRVSKTGAVTDLTTLPSRFSFRVICGTTGSGKSRLLQQLAGTGAQVLDLEAVGTASRLRARWPAFAAAAVTKEIRNAPMVGAAAPSIRCARSSSNPRVERSESFAFLRT